jgi:hypothetical protein
MLLILTKEGGKKLIVTMDLELDSKIELGRAQYIEIHLLERQSRQIKKCESSYTILTHNVSKIENYE